MQDYNRNPENQARRKALEAAPERKAARAAWNEANKEKVAVRMKTYNARSEVRERDLARQNKDRMTPKGRAQSLLKGVRHRCKRDGLAYNLDENEITRMITDCVCPYTMQPFVLTSGRHPWAPSIDRLDNAKGYTRDNVNVVSFWWNIAKNEWPESVTTLALAGLKRALEDMEFR